MTIYLNNTVVTNDHSELIHILHLFGLQKMEKKYTTKWYQNIDLEPIEDRNFPSVTSPTAQTRVTWSSILLTSKSSPSQASGESVKNLSSSIHQVTKDSNTVQ